MATAIKKDIDFEALDARFGNPSSNTNANTPSTPSQQDNNLEDQGINLRELDNRFGGPIAEQPTREPKWWQGFRDDLSWTGTAAKTGIGAIRGIKDVIDTGAHAIGRGVSYVADTVLPESLSGPIRRNVEETIAEDKKGRLEYDKEYPSAEGILPNSSSVGRFAGEVIGTAPFMPIRAFQGLRAGFGALPTIGAAGGQIAAPLINRLMASSAIGALGGATFNAATSSTNDRSLAENVGEGAITGAIAGPVLTGIGSAAKNLAGRTLGSVNDTIAQLALRAQQLGIPLKASQISTSPTLKKYDQISGMLPFSGAQNMTEQQANSFTRAISRIWGDNTSEITPAVIANARRRVGAEIEGVGQRSTVNADNQLGTDLRRIFTEAQSTVAESELRPIANQIHNIIDKIDNTTGTISGEAYLALTNYKGVLSRAQSSPNPNIKMWANEIREALDNALERSISDAERQILTTARGQYKAIMTVKELAESDPGGQISPLRLMRKVIQSPGGMLRSGELGEIANIGRQFFPQPADSGTPLGTAILERIAPFVHSPVSAGAAAAGALAKGATYMDLGLGAAALGVNRLFRSAVNNEYTRRSLINRGLGNTHGMTDEVVNRLNPYVSPIVQPRNPLQITVTPGDRNR